MPQKGKYGAPERNRTSNRRIRSAVLYPLSYGRMVQITEPDTSQRVWLFFSDDSLRRQPHICQSLV